MSPEDFKDYSDKEPKPGWALTFALWLFIILGSFALSWLLARHQ
jgi:hypothetical protein